MARAGGGRRRKYIAREMQSSLWYKPGLQVEFQSQLEAPTGIKCLVTAGSFNRDQRVTFSPGLKHEPALKVPSCKSCAFSRQTGDFSPGWQLKPGLKVTLQSQLELPAMTKPLIPIGGSNQDQNSTCSPGLHHKPGLHVPCYILSPSSSPSPSHFKLSACCLFLLVEGVHACGIGEDLIPPSILRF